MSSPLDTARTAFEKAFGTAPALACRAPGRVNLIGEHTDYNDGFVLPCAIDFDTVVVGRLRSDRKVQVVAADFGGDIDRFDLGGTIERRADAGWANYARGVVKELLARHPKLPGADLAVAGNVPQGAGLSSSASFEVALGAFFQQACGLGLSPTDLALIGQAAENRFVGIDCGIMDQLISARGVAGHALLIDCRTYAAEPVPLPAGVAVLIVHSRVRRGLVESEYNTRRAQCQAAARHYGVAALRDVTPELLEARLAGLDAVVLRRARHIVQENLRTVQAAQALRAGDLLRMGELMAQSHVSMRDDFEITVPAVDRLAELLQQAIGSEGGARMTGGGFGGCVVALLPEARVEAAMAEVRARYRSPDGEAAHLYLCHAADGAGTLALEAR